MRRMKSRHGAAKRAPEKKPGIFQLDDIPENAVFMIHQLLSLRDAARASLLTRKWLRVWRFYPNLEFTTKALGLKKRIHKVQRRAKFVSCVNTVIRHHAGTGVKSFIIKKNLNNQKYTHYLDRWMYFAVSSEHLKLLFCYLRPSPTFFGLSNLKTLELSFVRITKEDLESLLSYTFSLQELKLSQCPNIDHLRIPDVPSKLNYLDIDLCWIRALEIHIQNLVIFNYHGSVRFRIIQGEGSLFKEARFQFSCGDAIEYAITEMAPALPNLETLFLIGFSKMVIPTRDPRHRFHCLKHLQLKMIMLSKKYNNLCLVSFLDAAPFLESLIVHVCNGSLYYPGKKTDLRRLEKREPHKNLKFAKMTGFDGERSSIELALHILESSTNLECLILDPRKYKSEWKYIYEENLRDVQWRVHNFTISEYIAEAVPSHVKLLFS
ncbi:F-box/FBD/LRR-repeat protein At5g53840 isoform X2 [Oryza sativa Japonica Group]|uniref:F-box/FBD/LRR-repeat protein At5g53840 isoform X2 n=1 Tax=Oryza sativa subsp. japonica TaxID=39947 RepID=UPI00339D1E11